MVKKFDGGENQGGSAFDANDPTFNLGAANNENFYDEKTSSGGEVGGAPIIDNVNKQILAEMRAAAKKMGENPIFYEQIFEQFNREFWGDADKDIFQYEALVSPTLQANEPGFIAANTGEDTAQEFVQNEDSYNKLLGYARWWYSNKIPGLADNWGGSSSSGGSGGGKSGPSAADIRASFDLDQLANRVDDLFRSYLITESKDPRTLAKQYVDTIVSNPDQELDFDTWVVNNHIKKQPRYASIYGQKPEGMSEQQFLQPYLNIANQVLRPDNAGDAAIGGAQFGASPEAFRNRLARSNETVTSAPFMQNLEGRLNSLKGVLKG